MYFAIFDFSPLGIDNPSRESKELENLAKRKGMPTVGWWYLAEHFLVSFTEPGNIGFLNDYVVDLGGSQKSIGWY